MKAVLENLDGISDATKGEYEKGPDGKFHLKIEDIDGHASLGALKRAKQHESDQRRKAEADLLETRTQLEASKAELEERLRGTLPKSDLERLEKSFKEKESDLNGKLEVRDRNLKAVLVDQVAYQIAASIALNQDVIPLFLPHITPRLSVEYVDGKAITKILGPDGKPSSLTIDDLTKEISGNKAFANITSGSRASGSGASGGSGDGGAGPKKPNSSTATTAEWAAWAKAQREAKSRR